MRSTLQLAFTDNYERLPSEKYVVPLSNCLSLAIYSSTKPHNLKIANLQKGLILAYNGEEKIGEGTGFGLPILIYPRETFFAGSSTVSVTQTADALKIRKEFHMNRVARNRLGHVYLENSKARAFIRSLTALYQKNRHFRFLSLKELFVKMGVEAAFVKTATAGKVIVTYKIASSTVNVKVDFRQVRKARLRKVFVLNEQSAAFFRKYFDPHGSCLMDKQIGAWDRVDSGWACLTDLRGKVGFRLWNVEGGVLRRGRETMKSCLDWAGLDYEVKPDVAVFEYKIEVLGGGC